MLNTDYSLLAGWTSALVFVLCSSAAFWMRSRQHESDLLERSITFRCLYTDKKHNYKHDISALKSPRILHTGPLNLRRLSLISLGLTFESTYIYERLHEDECL